MGQDLWPQVVHELKNIAEGLDRSQQNEASIMCLRQRLTAVQAQIDKVHEHCLYMHSTIWYKIPHSWNNPVAHAACWVKYTNSYPLMPLQVPCLYHADRQCKTLQHVPPGSIIDIPDGWRWLVGRTHIWQPCGSCLERLQPQ